MWLGASRRFWAAERGMWRALSGCYWGALRRGRDEGSYLQKITQLADFGKPKRKAEGPCEKPLAVVSRGPGWGQWKIWEVTRR